MKVVFFFVQVNILLYLCSVMEQRKGILESRSGWMKGFVWFGIMVGLTVLVMTIWTMLPIDHQATQALKWFQFVQTLATFFAPPLLVAYLCSREPKEWLGLKLNAGTPVSLNIGIFIVAIVLMLVAIPGINLLAYWNSQMSLPDCLKPLEDLMRQQEEAAALLTERFLIGTGAEVLVANVVLMALLPAMSEEMTFRGVLQRLIAKRGATGGVRLTGRQHAAIWAVAIIFSAVHFQFFGFVPRMLLGALFGYALCWTGSLWIPITMHFVNNAATVVAFWIICNNNLNRDVIESFGTGETLWVGIVSLVLTGLGIYCFWRLSRTISKASSRIS